MLLAPLVATETYLVDMEGRVVNVWKCDCAPGLAAHLLANGNLLRAGTIKDSPFPDASGSGGRIQEFTWDGKLVWDFTYYSDKVLPHHDICKLPNGNVLINVWVLKSAREAIDAGRRAETVQDNGMLSCALLEVKPTGKTTGKIVWEWHTWDHLIQDFDAKKQNHGEVGAHPELIDLNFGVNTLASIVARPEELERLRAIGYIGSSDHKRQQPRTDWLHVNSLAFNAELDQIMLSTPEFAEVWIIDHSTTTAEAASHKGGRYGKGGDLLYRWGNPRAYRAGTVKNQKLFGQHDAHWIAKGLPGEGHVLILNNGTGRHGGAYSSVDEIVLPVDETGHYAHTAGKPYGPEKEVWTYVASKRTDFYDPVMSGAERLPNGDTLICSGSEGIVFEATSKAEVVWKYLNPFINGQVRPGPMRPGPHRPGEPPPGAPGMSMRRRGFPLFRAPWYRSDFVEQKAAAK
jgi:hypothetical protein